MKVKVTQSSPALCDPMDCIVYGTLQARILEWVAVPFSSRSSQTRDRTQVSCIAGGFFTSLSHKGSPQYTLAIFYFIIVIVICAGTGYIRLEFLLINQPIPSEGVDFSLTV